MGGSDSLITWDLSYFHGTSFQDYSPSSNMVSELYQFGLVCVTPNHISGLWEKYAMQQATWRRLGMG